MLISRLLARSDEAMVAAADVAGEDPFGFGCAHLFMESSRTSGATMVFHLACNQLSKTKETFSQRSSRVLVNARSFKRVDEIPASDDTALLTQRWHRAPWDNRRTTRVRAVRLADSISANIHCIAARHWSPTVTF